MADLSIQLNWKKIFVVVVVVPAVVIVLVVTQILPRQVISGTSLSKLCFKEPLKCATNKHS